MKTSFANLFCIAALAWMGVPVDAAVPQIAASDGRTLALKADGSVWAWGPNVRGSIGDGTLTDRWRPVFIGGGFVQVAVGSNSSFALKADGSLWAWGSNEQGQLGNGGFIDQLTPVQVGEGFAKITANWYAAYGIKRDGTLWSWGTNSNGVLGIGSADWSKHSLRPVLVGAGFEAVHSSQAHVLALKPGGELWGWGAALEYRSLASTYADKGRPMYVGAGFQEISAGEGFSLAIKKDGSLWGWGFNGYGQLGIGLRGTAYDPNPDPIHGVVIDGPVKILSDGVVAVTNGSFHTHALMADDSLLGWGMGVWGALGDGEINGSANLVFTPKKIADGFWKLTVGGGNNNGFAIKHDGSVWAWGSNYRGALGLGDTMNRAVPTPMEFNVFAKSGVTVGLIEYGAVNKKTIAVDVSPSVKDAGKPGCVFIAAVLPGSLIFTFSDEKWIEYRKEAPRAVYCGKLRTFQSALVQDVNLSGLTGTQIISGYGIGKDAAESLNDMLSRGQLALTYTIK